MKEDPQKEYERLWREVCMTADFRNGLLPMFEWRPGVQHAR